MQDGRPISVLILYSHPLLGEGLAGMLSGEPDLAVSAVSVDDAGAAECALAESPQVIIVERGDPDRAVEILELVPDALVIDVGIGPGPTFAYRRDEISAWPEAILASIHGVSSRPTGDPAPALEPPPGLAARS